MDNTSATSAAAGAPATAQQILSSEQNQGGGASASSVETIQQLVGTVLEQIRSNNQSGSTPPSRTIEVLNKEESTINQKLDAIIDKIEQLKDPSELDALKECIQELNRECTQEIKNINSAAVKARSWVATKLSDSWYGPLGQSLSNKLTALNNLLEFKSKELNQDKIAYIETIKIIMSEFSRNVICVSTRGFNSVQMGTFEKKKQQLVEGSVLALSGIIPKLSALIVKGGECERLLKEIHAFSIINFGINLATDAPTFQNKENALKFESFVTWVFNQKEFTKHIAGEDIQDTFRQPGNKTNIEAAIRAFSNNGSIEELIDHIEDNKTEDAQAFRSDTAAIIKQLCDLLIVGQTKINVASLTTFSTRILTIFAGADPNTYTYQSLSRAFPLCTVILNEVKREIDKFTASMGEHPIFVSFIANRGLKIGSDKFTIAMVKWMCFASKLPGSYYSKDEKALISELDPVEYPSICAILEEAKNLS